MVHWRYLQWFYWKKIRLFCWEWENKYFVVRLIILINFDGWERTNEGKVMKRKKLSKRGEVGRERYPREDDRGWKKEIMWINDKDD